MSHLSKIVRRVLIEADTKGTEPEEPSYWDEVGKTVDRYGKAIGDEVGAWGDAASELGRDVAGAASTLAKATLDTFVGQAHAPRDDYDVASGRARNPTLVDVIIPSIGSIISHLALTKFRISAKIADAAGLPARDIIAGKYGKEVMEDIFAGSVLHDVILGASFVPGAAVAGMLLDSVVYAAEGDRKGAIATLAMAGVFHAGGKIAATRADDAARGVVARKGGVEILAPKRYTDLNAAAKRGGFTHAVPPADRVTAIVKFVDDAGARMENAGVKGGRQIAASASQAVRSGAISIAPALEDARVAEAQQSAAELMTPGPGGETPLAAAKRIRNEVTVRKPVELPAEDRAGLDWLDSIAGLRRIETPEAEALRDALSSAREKLRADPTPANKKAVDDAVKLAIEKAYRKLEPGEIARSQGSSHEDLMRNPKNVMSTPAFVTTAKQLYSKLGYDVNIVPIVGTHDAMFDKYLAKYPKYATGGEDTIGRSGTRVVVVPHDEGKAILDAVEGVETKGGKEVGKMRVDTRGIGENTITIVPTVNSAGVDSLPTPWMISHGIFDSAAGNLLVQEGMLPATKKAVDRVESIFSAATDTASYQGKVSIRAKEAGGPFAGTYGPHNVYYAVDPATGEVVMSGGKPVKLSVDDPRVKDLLRKRAMTDVLFELRPEHFLGTAVNSKWGENSRTILASILRKAEAIGDAAAERGLASARGYIVTPVAPKDVKQHAEFKQLVHDLDDTLKRSAPMVGKTVKGVEDLPMGDLKRTKQGVQSVNQYLFRGPTDHIAEIMTAGVTKEAGYAPDLTLLDDPVAKLLFGEEGVKALKKGAAEIAALLGPGGQNIKDAFAEDMKGNVLFVFPD